MQSRRKICAEIEKSKAKPRPAVWAFLHGFKSFSFFSLGVDPSVFITQLQEGHLVVRHFQFLRWSAYREIPDSKKAFLNLLAQVQKWQDECGDGRTVVHCL